MINGKYATVDTIMSDPYLYRSGDGRTLQGQIASEAYSNVGAHATTVYGFPAGDTTHHMKIGQETAS